MKLIIDIDDKRIKGIKLLAKEQDIATPYPTLEQIIANGIPLDNLRAEIEPKCDRINSLASVLPYTAHREIQELLCEIIDKYSGVRE